MRRLRIILGITLAAVISGAALAYWYQGPTEHRDVSIRIAAAIVQDSAAIDLSEYADFKWTDVYIIPPFSSKDVVRSTMGISWPWRWGQIAYRDGIALLVFVDSTRIAGIVEHPRGQGDFVTRGQVQHFKRSDAVFAVSRRANSWTILSPVTGPAR